MYNQCVAWSSLQKKIWFARYYSVTGELWRQIPLVMKTTIILAGAVMIVLLCIRVYHKPGQQPTVHVHQVAQHSIAIYHSENLYTEPPSEKYRYSTLQLYPIFASPFFLKYHQHLGPYLSLQEALDQKKIVITELTGKEDQHTIRLPHRKIAGSMRPR